MASQNHDNISPSTSQCISKAQQHYESNGNHMKLILCMSVGLKDEDGKIFGDFSKDERCPKKNKKKFIPSNANLIDEIKRRKKIIDPSKEHKANSQMMKADAIE